MTAFGEWLLFIIKEIINFVVKLPYTIIEWLWEGFLDLLDSSFIMALLETAGDMFSAMPSGVWYFLSVVQFPFGVAVIISAYTLRFIVRRLPFIG